MKELVAAGCNENGSGSMIVAKNGKKSDNGKFLFLYNNLKYIYKFEVFKYIFTISL